MAHMADLAAKGSTVAIAAFEDPAYDFYPPKSHFQWRGGAND